MAYEDGAQTRAVLFLDSRTERHSWLVDWSDAAEIPEHKLGKHGGTTFVYDLLMVRRIFNNSVYFQQLQLTEIPETAADKAEHRIATGIAA